MMTWMITMTTSKIVIIPYSMASKSAKALQEALGCWRVHKRNSANIPSDYNVINWGAGGNFSGLNKPANVSLAVNKISTLKIISENGAVRTPAWTTNKEWAKAWVTQGDTVLCRTRTNGHSGQGIVIAKRVVDLVDAPLYTKYIHKDKEFRIHVFDGKVIDQRQKVPSTDGRPVGDGYICTHNNGYVFKFAEAPSDAHTQAINAVKALGLDFGAVDVVVEAVRGTGGIGISYKAYVLEVNTAPGLTGTTIQRYADAIKKRFE